ncbi:MAG: 5-oxoprolinase subunit PxpB [Spirochaetaceae bacterium]|nr:MAG: 5-oxoprolinase subunit PxpB [Spirochaetaceae bacterium]
MLRIHPAGDRCITVTVGRRIHPRIHHRVQRLLAGLDQDPLDGVIELVPSYCAIAVHYDPLCVTPAAVREWIRRSGRAPARGGRDRHAGRVVEIPTCYGGECGPDLGTVAEHANMTPDELIRLHHAGDYLVYMLGFTPGFPYLGGLNGRIAAPRRAEPRTRIPAGSVGIAGNQTGVYPIASPGGWQLIGRTPVRLFDLENTERPFLLEPGDRIRFVPISEGEYRRIAESNTDMPPAARPDAADDGPRSAAARIVKPGVFSTIQDVGRHGHQRYGMPVAGAMDQFALRAGNLLVGNPEDSAAIEFTFAGLEVEFGAGSIIAVCGARCALELIDRTGRSSAIRDWSAIPVPAGARIVVRSTTDGCRGYLCVSGGWQVPRVLGSAATYVRAGVGGVGGRALASGDILTVAASEVPARMATVPESMLREIYPSNMPIRVVLGPHAGWLSPSEVGRFLNVPWKVGVNSDRMGYRLEGPALRRRWTHRRELVSEGVEEGTVQVPSSGLPVVMLADRQTTGGYPKIAHVIGADLPRLAQAPPGSQIRFESVGIAEAHALLQRSRDHLDFVSRMTQEPDTEFLEVSTGREVYRIAARPV